MYRVRWPNSWEPEKNLLGGLALQLYLNGGESDDESENDAADQPKDGEEEWKMHKILEKRIVKGKVMRAINLQNIYKIII